jgi:predicted TIM-barrel fold metal-dependent hydrolase
MHGIEAFNEASFIFGQAAFWRPVLDEFPDLHLNLAHFGWNFAAGYEGVDPHNHPSWAREICDMMVRYRNLYTDVSHHYVLSIPDQRRFKDEYALMRADAGPNWERIKERILFGIDWHVIKRERDYAGFQGAYTEVVREGGLYGSDDLRDFLYRNAMRFLGLMPGDKNRQRLAGFYAAHGYEQPDWFKAVLPLSLSV